MNNGRTLDIERYLGGDMTEEEKQGFETELSASAELRSLLETYRTIDLEMQNTEKYSEQESALRKTLEGLSKVYFSEGTASQSSAPVVAMNKPRSFLKVAIAAAAVLVLVLSAYFLLLGKGDVTALADKYVKTELNHLSQTMDGARDSLQQGIAAYNNKDYSKAIALFEAVYQAHPDNSDALRYAGTTYLVTQQYDKAIERFDALAAKQLFSNHGLFLKAVTLLQRNQPGDKENAKQLLQQVVEEKGEGAGEAEVWLKEW